MKQPVIEKRREFRYWGGTESYVVGVNQIVEFLNSSDSYYFKCSNGQEVFVKPGWYMMTITPVDEEPADGD